MLHRREGIDKRRVGRGEVRVIETAGTNTFVGQGTVTRCEAYEPEL